MILFPNNHLVFRFMKIGLHALLALLMLTSIKVSAQVNSVPVTTVSAASYERVPVAAESIVSAFGTKLATATVIATDQNPSTPVIELPTTLGGTTVQVNGVFAGLMFVTPLQINYVIPAGISVGTATVKVNAADGIESNGTVEIAAFRPSLFTFNSNGRGVLAAEVVRVKANGSQTREALATFDTVTNRYSTKPIDLGPQGERVFLEIYATGIRGSQDSNNDGNLNENVWVLIGGNFIPSAYAGRQPFFAGLDQVNVELPRSLIGAGKINLAIQERLGACPSCLTQPGFTSQLVELEIASPTSNTPPQISSLSALTVTTGDTLFINGSGFSTMPKDNVVRIGRTRAKVSFASATQLTVPIPVGAQTGIVTVNTAQGEARSNAEITVKTSIHGNVETTSPLNPLQPVPLANIKVSIVGTNKTTTTNLQGVFSFQDVTPGNIELEFDPSTFPVQGLFTKVIVPMTVIAGRSNALMNSVWLTSTGSLTDSQTNTGTVVVGTFLEDDGRPIANADVRLIGQRNYSAVTDGNGAYIFRNVSVGAYVMSAGVQRPEGVVSRVLQDLEIVEPNMPVVKNSNLTSQEPNRPPVLFAPKSFTMNVNETREIPIYAAEPNIGQGLNVTVLGPPGTSILAGTNGAFTIRLSPIASFMSPLVVKATDPFGAEATQSIDLKVNAPNTAPTVTVPTARTIGVGQTLSFNVSATDPDAGQTITLVAMDMPQGASFTPTIPVGTLTGTFSWTPTIVGTYVVKFTATDNGTPPLSDAKTVSITVSSTPTPIQGEWVPFATNLPADAAIKTMLIKGNTIVLGGKSIYRSTDGGANWTTINNNWPATGIVSSAIAGNALLVGTGMTFTNENSGVFQSDDDGVTWRKIYEPRRMGAEVAETSTLGANGNVWFAGAYNLPLSLGTILYSVDAGANWNGLTNGESNATAALRPTAFVNLGADVFVAWQSGGGRGIPLGVKKLSAGNNGWTATATNIGFRNVNALAVVSNNLFAATGDNLLVSGDAGANWNPVSAIANASVVAATGTRMLVASTSGVLYSADGGTTWTPLQVGLEGKTIVAFTISASRMYAIDSNGKLYSQALPN